MELQLFITLGVLIGKDPGFVDSRAGGGVRLFCIYWF